jgi:hypothetical protein
MKYLIYIFIIFLSACSLTDNFDNVPARITIPSVSVTPEDGQGSGSHKIKDLWVFVNEFSLGVYELPQVIPIFRETDPSQITFFAGVRNNGAVGSPIQYPFYQPIQIDRSLEPGSEETLNLEFGYRPETVFEFVEDFENSNIFTFDEDGDEDTFLEAFSVDPLEGQNSGFATFGENDTLEIATAFVYKDLPLNGTSIFLEMDYKCNVSLNVGLIGILDNAAFKNYKIVLRPQENWNKIYIDFTEDVLASQLDGYRVVIGAVYDETETGGEPAEIGLDNLKFVHF